MFTETNPVLPVLLLLPADRRCQTRIGCEQNELAAWRNYVAQRCVSF